MDSGLAPKRARPGMTALWMTYTHCRDVGADWKPEYLRQRAASAVRADPPFTRGAGIPQHHLRRHRAGMPLKPAVDQLGIRRRLHAGAGALDPGLHQFEPVRRHAPVLLPLDLLDRMRP